ncbi:MAG: hypothetical protein GEV12_16065 [Micromonosporaceae bacterium]|nr:hypothetical protein [Micromonosporaceae bacterium]
MASTTTLLRSRGTGRTPVLSFELFFDLVYVFAVTQLAHGLLDDLTLAGLGHTTILLLAVWWAWMYTTWATNWFNPDHLVIRTMLIGVMLASLVMAVAIPQAFGAHGLAFAISYVALQVGRTAVLVAAVGRRHELGPTFQRILAWVLAAGCLWIVGGLLDGWLRVAVWILALLVDYAGPVARYATPRLGRSATTDWSISGDHLAERCQLFIIVALGETIVITGSTYGAGEFTAARTTAFVAGFLGSVAMWWIYFHYTAGRGSEQISSAADPGRIGRSGYTYLHLPMVAGIIGSAVAFDLAIAHPDAPATPATVATMLVGPALFLLGHAGFSLVVLSYLPRSRLVGVAVLAALGLVLGQVSLLAGLLLAMGGLVFVALWDTVWFFVLIPRRERRAAVAGPR